MSGQGEGEFGDAGREPVTALESSQVSSHLLTS